MHLYPEMILSGKSQTGGLPEIEKKLKTLRFIGTKKMAPRILNIQEHS
jgi:hypothetical protein